MKYFVGYSSFQVTNPSNVRFYDIDLVKRDLMNHFMTRKGERPMQPNFGFIGWDILFEPVTQSNRDLLINDAKRLIATDPRVEFLDCKVTEYEHGITMDFLLNFKPENVTDTLFIPFKRELTRDQE